MNELSSMYMCKRGKEKFHFGGGKKRFLLEIVDKDSSGWRKAVASCCRKPL